MNTSEEMFFRFYARIFVNPTITRVHEHLSNRLSVHHFEIAQLYSERENRGAVSAYFRAPVQRKPQIDNIEEANSIIDNLFNVPGAWKRLPQLETWINNFLSLSDDFFYCNSTAFFWIYGSSVSRDDINVVLQYDESTLVVSRLTPLRLSKLKCKEIAKLVVGSLFVRRETCSRSEIKNEITLLSDRLDLKLTESHIANPLNSLLEGNEQLKLKNPLNWSKTTFLIRNGEKSLVSREEVQKGLLFELISARNEVVHVVQLEEQMSILEKEVQLAAELLEQKRLALQKFKEQLHSKTVNLKHVVLNNEENLKRSPVASTIVLGTRRLLNSLEYHQLSMEKKQKCKSISMGGYELYLYVFDGHK